MASVSASLVKSALTCGLSPATTQQRPVARFNGLKAFPVMRRTSSVAVRSVASRRQFSVSCASNPETLDAVQAVIAKQLAIGKVSVLPESKFAELGADSLDTVEIMMALEEKFDIQFDEDNADKISTVQDAANLIAEVIAAKA